MDEGTASFGKFEKFSSVLLALINIKSRYLIIINDNLKSLQLSRSMFFHSKRIKNNNCTKIILLKIKNHVKL